MRIPPSLDLKPAVILCCRGLAFKWEEGTRYKPGRRCPSVVTSSCDRNDRLTVSMAEMGEAAATSAGSAEPALPGAAERAGLTAAGWPAVLAGAPVRTAAAAPAALPLVAAGSAAPVTTVVAAPVALPLVAVGSAVPVKTVAAAPAALPLVAAGSAVPVKTAAVVRVGPSVAVAAVP